MPNFQRQTRHVLLACVIAIVMLALALLWRATTPRTDVGVSHDLTLFAFVVMGFLAGYAARLRSKRHMRAANARHGG